MLVLSYFFSIFVTKYKLFMQEELLLCQCGDPAHQLIFHYDDTPHAPAVYVSVHLTQESNFFKRLWRGLKYIFSNKRSIYGDFDEIVLRPEDADKLQYAADMLRGIGEYYDEYSVADETDTVIPLIINPNKYKS